MLDNRNSDQLKYLFSVLAAELYANYNKIGEERIKSDALQQVLNKTLNIFNAEKCALFLVDEEQESLILEWVSGEVQFENLKDVGTYNIKNYDPLVKGTGVTPWVWFKKESFNAKNFNELINNSDGHWKGKWDVAMYGGSENAGDDFKCVYMTPLIAGEKCIGVLKYENRLGEKKYYEKDDEILIDMIAGLITNLVVSQRIERNRYDEILPKISKELISSFGQNAFFERLLEQCRRILSADLCSLFLVDSQDNLVLRSIVGQINDIEKKQLNHFTYQDYNTSKGLTPWILREGKAFNVRNYPDLKGRSQGNHLGAWDHIVYHGRPSEEFKSLYSIPLIVGNNKIGVLKVENKNIPPYYFTESDEVLFDLIGRLIAIGAIYDTEKYLGAMIRGAELGFLASGISHEFYNYLDKFKAIIANLNDMCDSNKMVKEKIIKLNKEIDSAKSIISHLQDVKNRQESINAFNPDDIYKDVIKLCGKTFVQKNIDINYHNDDVDELRIYAADYQTILINLLKNSFDSILEDGGKDDRVYVSLKKVSNDQFLLTVADNGKGIKQEHLDHIYLPFYTTKSPSGMGFGLYGVQRIVWALGGEINVIPKNQYGGATFEIKLPTYIRNK